MVLYEQPTTRHSYTPSLALTILVAVVAVSLAVVAVVVAELFSRFLFGMPKLEAGGRGGYVEGGGWKVWDGTVLLSSKSNLPALSPGALAGTCYKILLWKLQNLKMAENRGGKRGHSRRRAAGEEEGVFFPGFE